MVDAQQALLQIDNVTKSYQLGDETGQALRGVPLRGRKHQ